MNEQDKKEIWKTVQLVENNLNTIIQDPYYEGVIADNFQDIYNKIRVLS